MAPPPQRTATWNPSVGVACNAKSMDAACARNDKSLRDLADKSSMPQDDINSASPFALSLGDRSPPALTGTPASPAAAVPTVAKPFAVSDCDPCELLWRSLTTSPALSEHTGEDANEGSAALHNAICTCEACRKTKWDEVGSTLKRLMEAIDVGLRATVDAVDRDETRGDHPRRILYPYNADEWIRQHEVTLRRTNEKSAALSAAFANGLEASSRLQQQMLDTMRSMHRSHDGQMSELRDRIQKLEQQSLSTPAGHTATRVSGNKCAVESDCSCVAVPGSVGPDEPVPAQAGGQGEPADTSDMRDLAGRLLRLGLEQPAEWTSDDASIDTPVVPTADVPGPALLDRRLGSIQCTGRSPAPCHTRDSTPFPTIRPTRPMSWRADLSHNAAGAAQHLAESVASMAQDGWSDRCASPPGPDTAEAEKSVQETLASTTQHITAAAHSLDSLVEAQVAQRTAEWANTLNARLNALNSRPFDISPPAPLPPPSGLLPPMLATPSAPLDASPHSTRYRDSYRFPPDHEGQAAVDLRRNLQGQRCALGAVLARRARRAALWRDYYALDGLDEHGMAPWPEQHPVFWEGAGLAGYEHKPRAAAAARDEGEAAV